MENFNHDVGVNLFLGFDISTQGIKVTAISEALEIEFVDSISFDEDLPHFQTRGGVHRSVSDPRIVRSPTLMWIEGFDLLLRRMISKKFPFSRVQMISGSGQQHGSVYWKEGSSRILASLTTDQALSEQLRDAFSTTGISLDFS